MKIKKLIKNICLTALMSSLIFIITFFLQIPYFGGVGYFNLSDGLIIFSTIYFGPFVGIISAIIGTALADFASGFLIYIPFTIIGKGLEAILAFIIFYYLKNRKFLKYLSFILPIIPMVLTYFVSYVIYYDLNYALLSSSFDLIQGLVGSLISVVLFNLFKLNYHLNYTKNIKNN